MIDSTARGVMGTGFKYNSRHIGYRRVRVFKMTKQQLARKAGLPDNFFSRKKLSFRIEDAVKLADVLQCAPAEIVIEEGGPAGDHLPELFPTFGSQRHSWHREEFRDYYFTKLEKSAETYIVSKNMSTFLLAPELRRDVWEWVNRTAPERDWVEVTAGRGEEAWHNGERRGVINLKVVTTADIFVQAAGRDPSQVERQGEHLRKFLGTYKLKVCMVGRPVTWDEISCRLARAAGDFGFPIDGIEHMVIMDDSMVMFREPGRTIYLTSHDRRIATGMRRTVDNLVAEQYWHRRWSIDECFTRGNQDALDILTELADERPHERKAR